MSAAGQSKGARNRGQGCVPLPARGTSTLTLFPGGYNGNYTAWLARYPDIGLSVSMLCNSDHDDIHPHRLVDLFLPEGTPPREAPAANAAAPTTDLTMHTGVYQRADNGQLTLLTFPKDARMSGARYERGPDAFEFDANRPGRLTRTTYGRAAQWTRLPEWKPTPAALNKYPGRFGSDELLGSFDVRLAGHKLTLTVIGLSDITASLEPRAADVFEARGATNLDGLLVAFKRDAGGRVTGLAIAADALHELPFEKMERR
jgi:hypothetical protein